MQDDEDPGAGAPPDVESRQRGGHQRGARRRADLVGAGVQLLAERGWGGVTARAVAERAGTHQGLVHYHYGGLPAFKQEVAAVAAAAVFEPALEALTAHDDWGAGVAAALRSGDEATPEQSRICAELILASLQDEKVAELMSRVLAAARARLSEWLAGLGAPEPDGSATVLLAALDGLVLHRLIDPALSLRPAAAAATSFSLAQVSRAGQAGSPRG